MLFFTPSTGGVDPAPPPLPPKRSSRLSCSQLPGVMVAEIAARKGRQLDIAPAALLFS